MSARPSIDHTILSPNGRVSKRARAEALAREAARLFPPGYWDVPEPTERERLSAEADRLSLSAARLRDLAARGMSRRKFTKAADALDAEAAALLNAAGLSPSTANDPTEQTTLFANPLEHTE